MINFQGIKDAGFIDLERIVFEVEDTGDVGSLMLHCVRSNLHGDPGRQISNHVFHTYWFIDKFVEKGDLAVVYTKASIPTYKVKTKTGTGRRTHFFYWGLETAIWNRGDVAAVVGRFADWDTLHVNQADALDDIEP